MEIPGPFCLCLKAEDWPLVFEQGGSLWLPQKSVSHFMRMIKHTQSLGQCSIFHYIIYFVLFAIACEFGSF